MALDRSRPAALRKLEIRRGGFLRLLLAGRLSLQNCELISS